MKKLISVLAIVLVLCSFIGIMPVAAAEGASLTITFDTPNASREVAFDQDLELADYYYFNASYNGVWNTGVVGYDETEKCVYATSKPDAPAATVLRFHIQANSPEDFIDSSKYRYAVVEYKLAANMAQGATYTMQIRDAAWYSSAINIQATPNEWHKDPVDLTILNAYMKKGQYDIGGGDVRQNVGGGLGDDVATNGLMFQIETAYGNFAGAKLYVKSITFYEKKRDAFPEEEKPSSSTTPTSSTPTTSTPAQTTPSTDTTTSTSDVTGTVSTPSTNNNTPTTPNYNNNGTKPSYLKDEGPNVGLIIGIVAAVVVVLAAAAVVIFVVLKKKKNNSDQ